MAELLTIKLHLPLWRRAVVQGWIRVRVVQEMLFPGSVDLTREAERMAHFVCRVKIDG